MRYEVTPKWILDFAVKRGMELSNEQAQKIHSEIIKDMRMAQETPLSRYSEEELLRDKNVTIIGVAKNIAYMRLLERIAISRTFKNRKAIFIILDQLKFMTDFNEEIRNTPVTLGLTGKKIVGKSADSLWGYLDEQIILPDKEKYKKQIIALALATLRIGEDSTIDKMIKLFLIGNDPFEEKLISYNLELCYNQEKSIV